MRPTLLILLLVFGLSACQQTANSDKDKVVDKGTVLQEIAAAEAALYSKDKPFAFDAEKARNVAEAYEKFTTNFSDDKEKAPEYYFKSAEIYSSLKNYNKAINSYKTIVEKYPDYEKTPHSVFLLGFRYENDLKKLKEAKTYYEQFLAKYPNHELADDVQFSLKNLGKTPEEIIKQFEENTKKEK